MGESTTGMTLLTPGRDEISVMSACVRRCTPDVLGAGLTMMVVGPRLESADEMLLEIPAVCDVRAIMLATPTRTIIMVSAALTFLSMSGLYPS